MKKLVTSLFAVLLLVGLAQAKQATTKYELALINAAKEGNASQIRGLLEAGTDPNVTDKDGNTPLIYAAKENLAAVDMLLYAGADVNAKGENGITPLINSFSVVGPEANTIRTRLLKAKPDVNAVVRVRLGDEARMTAWTSCFAGEWWHYGYTPGLRPWNHPVNGSAAALSFAVASDDISAVEMLLKNGADVNVALFHPVLHTAIYSNKPNSAKIVEMLLKAGADPWQHGETVSDASHIFAFDTARFVDRNKKRDLINHAIKELTSHNKLDKKLLAAAKKGKLEQVKKLLGQGANPNARNKKGSTPLMENIENKKTNMDVIQALLDAGANPNIHPAGYVPLYTDVEIARKLIKAGANINARNRSYSTALFPKASRRSHKELSQLLLRAGADVNVRNMYGQTPLFSANAETAQILVDAGADVNVRDYEGLSALFVASVHNDDDSVKKAKLLRRHGASLTPHEQRQLALAKQKVQQVVAEYDSKYGNEGGFGQTLMQGLLNAVNDTANFAIQNAGKF